MTYDQVIVLIELPQFRHYTVVWDLAPIGSNAEALPATLVSTTPLTVDVAVVNVCWPWIGHI